MYKNENNIKKYCTRLASLVAIIPCLGPPIAGAILAVGNASILWREQQIKQIFRGE